MNEGWDPVKKSCYGLRGDCVCTYLNTLSFLLIWHLLCVWVNCGHCSVLPGRGSSDETQYAYHVSNQWSWPAPPRSEGHPLLIFHLVQACQVRGLDNMEARPEDDGLLRGLPVRPLCGVQPLRRYAWWTLHRCRNKTIPTAVRPLLKLPLFSLQSFIIIPAVFSFSAFWFYCGHVRFVKFKELERWNLFTLHWS